MERSLLCILFKMASALTEAPEGSCTGWGIPFEIDRLALTSAHCRLHKRMHERGFFHQHTPAVDHVEHH